MMNDLIQQYSDAPEWLPYLSASFVAGAILTGYYLSRLVKDITSPDPTDEDNEYDLTFYRKETKVIACGQTAPACCAATKL